MGHKSRNLTRRDFLQKFASGVGVAAIAGVGCQDEKGVVKQQLKRPNIIFVHTDSWDGRILGCLGHPAMKRATPNIDSLAKRGVAFRNTYCNNPVCCPSRSSMWSGTHTFRCEGWNNHKGLEKGTPTVMTHLKNAGYRFAEQKGGFGKNDYLSGKHSQLNRMTAWTATADIQLPAFRQSEPEINKVNVKMNNESDWISVEKGKKFLVEHLGDEQPFFLYVGIRFPHPPFRTSQRWLDMVDADAVTLPPEDKQLHPVMKYQRIYKNWMHGFSSEEVLKTRKIYYAMCAETDAMVGELTDEMDKLGLADNTYFIFSSDHGENNMEHRQYYKMNMYESSARVPLVIAGPGIQQGVILDNIVSLIDIYPTLMDMARLKYPGGLDGQSLMPLLRGETKKSRNQAFSMFTGCSSNTSIFMLRKGHWKYIAYAGYEPQLFNLADDPEEIDNIAAKRPDIVKQMDAELREICDYNEVHKRRVAYDKRSFIQWRRNVRANGVPLREYGANIDNASYEQVMANSYMGWGPEHEAKLERWLSSD